MILSARLKLCDGYNLELAARDSFIPKTVLAQEP
ncbi:hypothetical protein TRIP_B310008 [uncultured Desulfatiglans sp.]|nr:hypothetical protein TRIP_B310008 [uncultured Desulfatiglans sp.]